MIREMIRRIGGYHESVSIPSSVQGVVIGINMKIIICMVLVDSRDLLSSLKSRLSKQNHKIGIEFGI